MANDDLLDAAGALDERVRTFFAGHAIDKQHWPVGPIDERLPDFFVYEIGPGPRFPAWSYLTSGCWAAAAWRRPDQADAGVAEDEAHRGGGLRLVKSAEEDRDIAVGLEFILSANAQDLRHVEVLTMLAYGHAGSDPYDLGHSTPIGESWMHGSACDHLLISLPYAYGPRVETCHWRAGRIRILAAMPITEAEHTLAISEGHEALERRLESALTDFTNPARASVV
jgi:Suppressor of fused protein (SUFU)